MGRGSTFPLCNLMSLFFKFRSTKTLVARMIKRISGKS
nr:MAG TPA: hypothetical protein [Caudoviricetes sp.]